MPPPPIHYVVLLFGSFAFAIGLAFYVATSLGSRHRKGSRLGIVLGAPLSVSAGILAGCFSWAISEDWHLPDLLYLTWGPLCGTFTVTLAMSFLAREVAVLIFLKLASRPKARATETSIRSNGKDASRRTSVFHAATGMVIIALIASYMVLVPIYFKNPRPAPQIYQPELAPPHSEHLEYEP